jgi:DNA-binding transcriptional MerR regulator
MKQLSIGDVARKAGVAASAVRYYESIGLLPGPVRLGGQRRYDGAILDRLRIIEIAKSLDFTLDEIGQLFEGVSEDSAPTDIWRAFAEAKLQTIEKQIEHARQLRELLRAGLSCECVTLSDCLSADPACTPG